MLTIAWDVDDVLNDLTRLWFEGEWLKKHRDCGIGYEQLSQNPPSDVLSISLSEYLESLDAFRLSDAVRRMKPVPEIKDWFVTYGHRFRHIAVTATPRHAAPRSANWVINNFGDWIRTFHFIPPQRDGKMVFAYDAGKTEFLSRYNDPVLLIDDSEKNVDFARKAGHKAVLMPRPWNANKTSVNQTLNLFLSIEASMVSNRKII